MSDETTAAEKGEVNAAGTRVAEAHTEVISGPHPSEPERLGNETDGNFEEGSRDAQYVPIDGSSLAEPGDPGTEAEVTPVEEAPEEDPASGTISEILANVGDDPVKAQAALDAENATGSPRATLVSKLEAIIG